MKFWEAQVAFAGIGMMAVADKPLPQMIGALGLVIWVASAAVLIKNNRKRIEALERRLDANGIYE